MSRLLPIASFDAKDYQTERMAALPEDAAAQGRQDAVNAATVDMLDAERLKLYASVRDLLARATQATPDAWKEISDRYMGQWNTHGQKAILQAEHDRGVATGKSWSEIGAALGQIVKGWERGR